MASAARHERRALVVGLAGNLVGALSGIGMYLHSRSDALLLDGLYTGVLAAAGLVALQVSRAVHAPRNRAYPFGASGQEPLYMLFQSLVMIGMVLFAGVTAASKLIAVASGGTAPVVELSGL
ncbi:MAG: cation transporter, partial [Cyanobacteria bacterium M_surface_7_m2_040]|nr:cation transporter [Cyanobacteria bacterium M_surface_7_m2_040]